MVPIKLLLRQAILQSLKNIAPKPQSLHDLPWMGNVSFLLTTKDEIIKECDNLASNGYIIKLKSVDTDKSDTSYDAVVISEKGKNSFWEKEDNPLIWGEN